MKPYFVILHYQNSDVTLRCIAYLKKLKSKEPCHIVIVDNASPNKSGLLLKRKFAKDGQVKVICNSENLGFAKGNNIGYQAAKAEGADVIVVLNSDVMILQDDFLIRLMRSGLLRKFEVIGPDIITKSSVHQNPFRDSALSMKRLRRLIRYQRFLAAIYQCYFLGKGYLKVKSRMQKQRRQKSICRAMQPNAVLHGACLIYSKNWIEHEECAFLPITFMYGEEDILFEYVQKKGYQTVFCPDLKALHEEDASIDSFTKNEVEKRKFISAHMLHSFLQLKKLRGKEMP